MTPAAVEPLGQPLASPLVLELAQELVPQGALVSTLLCLLLLFGCLKSHVSSSVGLHAFLPVSSLRVV